MKAYIAASLHDKEKILRLYQQLKIINIDITHDWTTHHNIRPYQHNLALAEQYATADFVGVKEADIFIFLTNPEIGSSSSGELGVAIMLNLCFGKPVIYVIGEHLEKNIFFYHPIVTKIANTELLLTTLMH